MLFAWRSIVDHCTVFVYMSCLWTCKRAAYSFNFSSKVLRERGRALKKETPDYLTVGYCCVRVELCNKLQKLIIIIMFKLYIIINVAMLTVSFMKML